MNARYGHIPTAVFESLASGSGGPEAIRELTARRYRKHAVLFRGVLAAGQSGGAERARLIRQGYDLLAEIQRHHPEAAKRTILYPSVGAWALRVVRAHRNGVGFPGAYPDGMGAVAATAAILAGFPSEIEVAISGKAVMLPSLGAADVDGQVAVVRNAEGGAEVLSAGRSVKVPADPYEDGPGWRGLRRVQTGSLDVLIDDIDPFRMPSSADLSPRLSADDLGRLSAALRSAWPILEEFHPGVAAEVAEAVTVIVPLISARGGRVSSSSSATFGAVGLSEPSDPYWCAETFAHEIQHLKLSALLDIVPMTLPDNGRRYYAPWREDPRPIGGLVQGAYAFLGVSAFWRRQRRSVNGALRLRADSEFARWREATGRGIETLQSSERLTPAGADFVRGMARTLDTWRDESVSREALDLARDEAERHLARWQLVNGPLPA
jgi:uncharacterized protein